jgi:hypothetical protein
MSEANECQHYWIPNGGKGGGPEFKPNRFMHPTDPMVYAKCSVCGSRVWFTKTQWAAIPVTGGPEPARCKS